MQKAETTKNQSIIFLENKIPIITIPIELDEKRRRDLGEFIEKIESGAMNIEEGAVTTLKIELNQYPEIDPSFLNISNEVDYAGHRIKLPKFGVFEARYETDKERQVKKIIGFDDFAVSFGRGGDDWVIRRIKKWREANVRFCYRDRDGRIADMIKPLTDELVQSSDFIGVEDIEWNGERNPYRFTHLPRGLFEKYAKIIGKGNSNIDFVTSFSGLIPERTKEKIKEAEKVFPGTRGVYLIAETKPQDWRKTRLQIDPLLVGIHNDKMFLIDHFNTTPLEAYVRKDFLK